MTSQFPVAALDRPRDVVVDAQHLGRHLPLCPEGGALGRREAAQADQHQIDELEDPVVRRGSNGGMKVVGRRSPLDFSGSFFPGERLVQPRGSLVIERAAARSVRATSTP